MLAQRLSDDQTYASKFLAVSTHAAIAFDVARQVRLSKESCRITQKHLAGLDR